MTRNAVLALLRAHFGLRGITFADNKTGERMYALRERDIDDLAELLVDTFPATLATSWEDEITQEIPRHTLDRLREESEQ